LSSPSPPKFHFQLVSSLFLFCFPSFPHCSLWSLFIVSYFWSPFFSSPLFKSSASSSGIKSKLGLLQDKTVSSYWGQMYLVFTAVDKRKLMWEFLSVV
jgi:hypothetical protein